MPIINVDFQSKKRVATSSDEAEVAGGAQDFGPNVTLVSVFPETGLSRERAFPLEAFTIGLGMRKAGVPDRFVARAVVLSGEFPGILRLMRIWRDEIVELERNMTIAAIEELIEDCTAPPNPGKGLKKDTRKKKKP